MSTIRDKHVILTDFLLSRQALLCSENTIEWYERMISPFTAKYQFTSKDIRFFLATTAQRNVSSSTAHAHARALRAFMNFCYEEEYINKPIKFHMPRVHRRRMEVRSLVPVGIVNLRLWKGEPPTLSGNDWGPDKGQISGGCLQ
jgi:site-specific recombinase XerD